MRCARWRPAHDRAGLDPAHRRHRLRRRPAARRARGEGRTVRCLARRPEYLRPRVAPSHRGRRGRRAGPRLAGRRARRRGHRLLPGALDGRRRGRSRTPTARGARNFARAARAAGVRRIIYLGGLGGGDELSSHLDSRQEVGRILRESGVPTIEFRASIILGSGSVSFEMIRALVETLPVMITPRWVATPTQPIGIEDVIAYLREALDLPGRRERGLRDRRAGPGVLRRADAGVRPPARAPPGVHLGAGADAAAVEPLAGAGDAGLRPGRAGAGGRSPERDRGAGRLGARQRFAVRPLGMQEAMARALANEDRAFAATRWSDALSAAGRAARLGRAPVRIPAGGCAADRRWPRRRPQAFCADPADRRRHRLVPRQPAVAAPRAARPRWWAGRASGAAGATRSGCCPGDTLDFWRVEAVEPDRLLRLAAEMRLPGPGLAAVRGGSAEATGASSTRPRSSTRSACSASSTGTPSGRCTSTSSAGCCAALARAALADAQADAAANGTTDLRIHAPPDSGPRHGGEFVLYWMQTTQRAHDNFALNFAIEQANALGLPLQVYHGLRHDYPWASDRFHTWILEAVIDLHAGFAAAGINYAFWLDEGTGSTRSGRREGGRREAAPTGPTAALRTAPRRSSPTAPRWSSPTSSPPSSCRGRSGRCGGSGDAGDRGGLRDAWCRWRITRRSTAPPAGIRPVLMEALPHYLWPVDNPDAAGAARRSTCPFESGPVPTRRTRSPRWWPRATSTTRCRRHRSSAAAPRRAARGWREFLAHRPPALRRPDRNDPNEPDAVSRLSPYLHFGNLSIHEVLLAARDAGPADQYAKFLDEALTWRELAHNFCYFNPKHRTPDGMPAWAREQLQEHEADPRPGLYSDEELEQARTGDDALECRPALLPARWLDAQLHADAVGQGGAAVDARTPPSACGCWSTSTTSTRSTAGTRTATAGSCGSFGKFDRPFYRRPIYGTVRYQSLKAAREKFDVPRYIARYGGAHCRLRLGRWRMLRLASPTSWQECACPTGQERGDGTEGRQECHSRHGRGPMATLRAQVGQWPVAFPRAGASSTRCSVTERAEAPGKRRAHDGVTPAVSGARRVSDRLVSSSAPDGRHEPLSAKSRRAEPVVETRARPSRTLTQKPAGTSA